jgi:hypothetical protein
MGPTKALLDGTSKLCYKLMSATRSRGRQITVHASDFRHSGGTRTPPGASPHKILTLRSADATICVTFGVYSTVALAQQGRVGAGEGATGPIPRWGNRENEEHLRRSAPPHRRHRSGRGLKRVKGELNPARRRCANSYRSRSRKNSSLCHPSFILQHRETISDDCFRLQTTCAEDRRLIIRSHLMGYVGRTKPAGIWIRSVAVDPVQGTIL